MNEAQQQLADRMGELLAESPMDEEIKTLLSDNMEKIPENLLFKLKDALEMEQEALEETAFEIQIFLKEQDANWGKLAEEQKKVATTLVDAWAEKLRSTTE